MAAAVSPHIAEPYSPLDALIRVALRRMGGVNARGGDGDTTLMFLEFANLILSDINQHPYWRSAPLDFYKSQSETRRVPDQIMVAGLLFYYASQQASEKTSMYQQMYTRTLNGQLWHLLNGNTPIRMIVTDNGSAGLIPEGGVTNPINGSISHTEPA